MTTYNFAEQLDYSHRQSDAPWWNEVYRQAFPDMIHSLDLRHQGWHQNAGRDRMIVLNSGRSIYVDEKVRTEAYDDILFEVWSTYPKNGRAPFRRVPGASEGWGIKPLDCDFLAYAFEPSRTCYLFPFLGLRAAWAKHAPMWIGKATDNEGGYRWIVAPNQRYNTISIAVPTRILQECVNDALTICWAVTTSD